MDKLFMITEPGDYRTRGGRKAEIVGKSQMGWLGICRIKPDLWGSDGKHFEHHSLDLIAPWTEPKSGTVWVNVYTTGSEACESLEEAHRRARLVRATLIACVEVKWTEGEGL